MALEGATADVQLTGLDQKSTTAGAVPGELSTLINARTRKFQSDKDGAAHLRIEKREGFTRLTRAVRNPAVGSSVSTTASIPYASLLATRQDQPVAIDSSAQAYLYEPEQPAWEIQGAYQITNKLTRNPIYTPNAQITTPDGAAVGNVFMYALREGAACKLEVRDRDGTLIRNPITVTAAGRIKCVSDGVRFWVITDNGGTTLTVRVYAASGGQVASQIFDTLLTAASAWDVIYQPSVGVSVVRPLDGGVHLTTMAYTTGIDTLGSGDETTSGHTAYGVAFIANPNNDSLVYVASLEAGDDPIIHVVSMSGSAVLSHDYEIGAAGGTQFRIANFAGYVIPATLDVRLFWTQLAVNAGPTAGDMKDNLTMSSFAPFSGSPANIVGKRSVSIASRAFTLNNRWLIAVYYASQQSALDIAFGLTFRQATFFLLDMQSLHIVGRFEYGTAAMDWTVTGWTGAAKPTNGFMLPTPFIDSASGIHVPFGYRATAQASRFATNDIARFFATAAAPLISWLPQLFQQYTNTIGVLDITLRAEHGKAVEFNELLLPGAVATSFSGQDFGESNFNLAPERPIAITTGGGGLTPNQTYQLCVVWEWTNAAGQRVKSAPSPPLEMVMGADTEINATLYTLRVTEHANVMASVYMTYMVNGLMSTTFAKATDDLTPTYNSTTADTIQWDSGTLTDDQIAVGEPLYTDGNPGHLPNYPLPPFSQGCQAWNRVFVVGPDGAIWFTFEDDEVSALAGNPAFRILPPNEPFTRVVNMDAFLLIGSEKRWYILERGNLPDSTGAGSIPTPAVLPFPNGVTGAVQVTRDGCFYGSSSGGIWLITRDLQNVYVGAKAEDYTGDLTIADMTTDKDQNVIASVVGGFVVWDPVSRTWGKWSLPGTTRTIAIDASDNPTGDEWVFVNGDFTDLDIGGTVTPAFAAPNTAFNIPYTITDVLSATTVVVTPTPAVGFTNPATGNTVTVTRPDIAPLLATWRGRLMFSDADRVWVQTADSYADIEGATQAAIITTFSTAPIHLGGVKNFKRLWDQQIFGEYYGDHDLTVAETYDDAGTPVVATYEFTPDGTAPYHYQLPVKVELCTSVAFTFTDSFPRTVSRGFALELISFYVGLEKGLARVPIARRIAPTG